MTTLCNWFLAILGGLFLLLIAVMAILDVIFPAPPPTSTEQSEQRTEALANTVDQLRRQVEVIE